MGGVANQDCGVLVQTGGRVDTAIAFSILSQANIINRLHTHEQEVHSPILEGKKKAVLLMSVSLQISSNAPIHQTLLKGLC